MIEIYEHVAFVSYRFKPRFATDEGGFLEFPFKYKTLFEDTGLACRVPLGWLIAQCRSRAMKDYVTHTLGCMEMDECMESDFTQGYEPELQKETESSTETGAHYIWNYDSQKLTQTFDSELHMAVSRLRHLERHH